MKKTLEKNGHNAAHACLIFTAEKTPNENSWTVIYFGQNSVIKKQLIDTANGLIIL